MLLALPAHTVLYQCSYWSGQFHYALTFLSCYMPLAQSGGDQRKMVWSESGSSEKMMGDMLVHENVISKSIGNIWLFALFKIMYCTVLFCRKCYH